MIKKIIMILFVILLMNITLASCNEEEELMEKYPSLIDQKHIIKELSGEEVVEKISNQESFIIMLGFEACPWCQALIPEYNEVGKELKIKELYYLDIKDMRDNDESKDRIYYQALYGYFNEIVDIEKNRINAPTVLGIKEGKLVGFNLDTVPSHVISETGVLPPLTNEQKAELHQLLKELFNKVYN